MEPFVQPDVLTPLLARTIRRQIRQLPENMVGPGHSPHPIFGSEQGNPGKYAKRTGEIPGTDRQDLQFCRVFYRLKRRAAKRHHRKNFPMLFVTVLNLSSSFLKLQFSCLGL